MANGGLDDATSSPSTRPASTSWPRALERPAVRRSSSASSGASRADMERFARDVRERADSAVFVWSMGITQHASGADNVRAIVNLGAGARQRRARRAPGLMPIRGHSGVQGGAEMGAYATALPGGVPVDARIGGRAVASTGASPSRPTPGLTAAEMVEAPRRGELDVLYSSGGNFLDTLPDPASSPTRARAGAAARAPGHRRHQPDAGRPGGEEVLLLPAATRYEQRGGGTETTTERRIAFSPEIRAARSARRAAEWEIFRDLAAAGRPRARATCSRFDRARRSARRSPRSCPSTTASRTCATTGDQVQWGGARLCDGWDFPTARRQGALRRRSSPRELELCPRAASCCRPGAASSSTRWSSESTTR